MALSKSSRIIILLVIDTAFLILELSTGYAVHSLALVADAFHMLNDVLSLCVGLWAVRVAHKSSSSKMYTYGWQRAETLGALVNGVFLVALCVTIFLDAIERFVEPKPVDNPKLVLVVGCLGLGSNLLGLLLFHEHNHGPGGHSHGPQDQHSHAEEGHAHGHIHDHTQEEHDHHAHDHAVVHSPSPVTEISDTTAVDDPGPTKRGKGKHGRSRSQFSGVEDVPVAPRDFRQSIIAASHPDPQESDDGTDQENDQAIMDDHDEANGHTQEAPLLSKGQTNYGTVRRKSLSHHRHHHRKPKTSTDGHGHSHSPGHSHGDLNMRGIFLHVMGDALGNIGVIATALIIWLSDVPWRFYFDPAISLFITVIILCSAIPLCKAASRILLQAVPYGLSIDEIKEDIEDLSGIISCHDIHVWQLSDTQLVASLHVQVDFDFEGEGAARYMQLAQAIRQCLHEFGIHSSTIQPEFYLHGHSDAANDAGGVFGSGSALYQQPGSLSGSKAGSQRDVCLLDCGENCNQNRGCCGPALKDSKVGKGSDHEH